MKKVTRIALALFAVTLIMASCTFPSGNPVNVDQAAVNTSVAQTLISLRVAGTQSVDQPTVGADLPTVTNEPLSTAVLPTSAPSSTEALPTNTPLPSAPPATATNTPVPCNRASFVNDVTYADYAELGAGTNFTKTWRIKNNGSCTWNSSYVILFDSGEQMGAPATSSITSGSVSPGETADISVNLKAPSTPGTYQGNFRLRSSDNIVFGVNADGQGPFWVKIVVPPPTPMAADTPFPTLPPPPPPLMPDLVITQITYSPAAPHKGDLVTVKVTTYNQGTLAAGPYTVEWYAAGPTLGCSWNVADTVARGGLVLTCTYTYGGWNHGYVTKAIADTGNTVAESDESNNTKTQVLDVSP